MGKKRHRTSRRRHRRVSRNPRVLANRARGVLRRLTRNVSIGGIDVIEKILFPALGATGGMMLAQWAGSKASATLGGQDPKLVMAGAAVATAFAAYMVGERVGLSPETQASVAAGAGVVAIGPWLPFAMLRDTVAQTTSAAAPNAVSGFYQRSMLAGNLMVDVSHAGAPYKGMFGLGQDMGQDVFEDRFNQMEAISTVEPIDGARQDVRVLRTYPIVERMASPDGRGYAGGIWARNLFSGLMPT